MARTVTDAAILLGALTGVDARDGTTEASRGQTHPDYTRFLDPDGLRGVRLGVARKIFQPDAPGAKLIESALDEMKALGATLVDFEDDIGKGSEREWEVLQYEFKAGINAYLATLGPQAPVHNLQEIIEFNRRNQPRELAFFGQETLVAAQGRGPLTEQAYLDALASCRRLSREEGIDAMMNKHQLDAIVAPSGGPAAKTDHVYGDRDVGGSSSPAAVAGYPNITVPAGQCFGLPVGISFFGRAWSESILLKFAFAFEQRTKVCKPPTFPLTVG